MQKQLLNQRNLSISITAIEDIKIHSKMAPHFESKQNSVFTMVKTRPP